MWLYSPENTVHKWFILTNGAYTVLIQGIPSGGQAAGPEAIAPDPAAAAVPAAVPTGDVAAAAHTGSSPSAWDGEWPTHIHPKECLFLSSLSDPLDPPATSQPPKLLEKPAPVPSVETAGPAERRPASRIAAGDRQGKPGAPAGQRPLSCGESIPGAAIRRASCVTVPLQEIRTNQEDFIQMLNEPNPEAVPGGGELGARGTAGDTSNTSPMRYIQVTPQEKEAIERVRTTALCQSNEQHVWRVLLPQSCLVDVRLSLQLKALGFPEGLVIQAYFACEKNENLAANFLLQQNFEDD